MTRSLLAGFATALFTLVSCSGCSDNPDCFCGEEPGSTDDPSRALQLGDPHHQGQADELRLASVSYGRLVDLIHLDSSGVQSYLATDVVVPYGLAADGVRWQLDSNGRTGRTKLIGRASSEAEVLQRIAALDFDLDTVPFTGLAAVPGDAVWVLRFNDLLDRSDPAIGVEVGTRLLGADARPATARILFDVHHGGAGPDGRWAPTRVLVDPTVSAGEALGTSLALNPGGIDPQGGERTWELRLATLAAEGAQPLRNLAGRALGSGEARIDFQAPQRQLLIGAAVTAAGTGVQNLAGAAVPELLSTLQINIPGGPIPDAGGDPLRFTLAGASFVNGGCAYTPRVGDALLQEGQFLLEVVAASPPLAGNVIERLTLRLLNGDAASYAALGASTGELTTSFDSSLDQDRSACFVTIDGKVVNAFQPDSALRVRFSSEVLLAGSDSYDGLFVGRRDLTQEPDLSGSETVPGQLAFDPLGVEIEWTPAVPLHHEQGLSESYYLHFLAGDLGLAGAGGASVGSLPRPIELSLDPSAASVTSGGHVTRFVQADEYLPMGGATEWGGSLVYDPEAEAITPRPVTRFSAQVDPFQPIVSLMTPFLSGVQSPMNALGAKTQVMWRYADMGFEVQDPTLVDIDVEGLAWAPSDNQVIADEYDEFEIALSHGEFQPDEFIEPTSFFPRFPSSGLRPIFANNEVDPAEVVHDRQLGYTVNPGDAYLGMGGTLLQPYPLNLDQPLEDQATYTWRDTSIQVRKGVLGGGVPLQQELLAKGQAVDAVPFNPSGQVQSIGLPLVMDFRCFADSAANGLNSVAVSLAANTSSRPYFRAFSAGGIDTSGNAVIVDPDLETVANGGFRTGFPVGAPTFGRDNIVNYGAVDFVVRVSRAYSIWRPALSGGNPAVVLDAPVYEPTVVGSVEGARSGLGGVEVSYRGASMVASQHPTLPGGRHPAVFDARTLDVYGDHYDDTQTPAEGVPDHSISRVNLGVDLLGGSDAWVDDVDGIQGARWYQLRLTMVGDLVTGEVPVVTSVASAWLE